MIRFLNILCVLVIIVACGQPNNGTSAEVLATGPLRVSSLNPRYFTDGSGKVVYLTGSHVWDCLQDWGGVTPRFDYSTYLNFLQANNHNFIRLWKIGESTEKTFSKRILINPLPWQRTGPGVGNDGEPKFDLTKFNQAYFDRLRSRVNEADRRGIYVSVMLFDGIFDWSTHPFNGSNNINGINGDLNGDGDGREIFTLASREVTERQKAYIRKTIDTVNDLDNVLYEVANEIQRFSIKWQYHIVDYIHEYEKKKPKQHPVGMTSSGGIGLEHINNNDLFDSPAEWISPRIELGQNYPYDPPAADGRKVIISDTDHLGGVLQNPTPEWVWKSFLRGLNPILMDVLQNPAPDYDPNGKANDPNRPELPATRRAMGDTLRYARRMNLARMTPQNDLSSTKYCLADPGSEYLIYLPYSSVRRRYRLLEAIGVRQKISIDLSGSGGRFHLEWFNPATGETTDGGMITGGAVRFFRAPFSGDAVLYIYRADSRRDR